MSASDSSEHVQQIEQTLFKGYTDLLSLVNSFEKGSTADITARLRSVESGLQELRESVKQIPDISSVEQHQIKKIKDIYRQIKQKDDLIDTFKGSDDGGGGQSGRIDLPTDDVTYNDQDFQCPHCPCKILTGRLAVWCERSCELPLPRQQKGVDTTQTETITGCWEVKRLFDFHDAGFTNATNGVRYITCAECEFGPVGLMDAETKLCYVAKERIRYAEPEKQKEAVVEEPKAEEKP